MIRDCTFEHASLSLSPAFVFYLREAALQANTLSRSHARIKTKCMTFDTDQLNIDTFLLTAFVLDLS